jgi:hypothetical protein
MVVPFAFKTSPAAALRHAHARRESCGVALKKQKGNTLPGPF